MEVTKNTINTCEITAKGTTQAMADGDVIVPDTKPDILKLLQVDSDACITDKYIENGRLVLCGRVDYKVLYIPDRENEKIKSILTSMEFRQVVDGGGADENSKILARSMVERVEFNTVNSRKLRLRAIIHVDYEVCSLGETEISTDIEDDTIEKRLQNIAFENTVNISEHDFTLREKLEIPNGERCVGEVLKTDVKIYDMEYKPVTGKVIVKGIASICVLYTDESGEIKFTESEAPFTEVLDAEEVTEDAVCDIDYYVIGVMCTPENDIDGDLRELSVDIDICASLKATRITDMQILQDCFVPYTKTECERETLTLKSTVERPSSQNTLREIVEIPQNSPSVNGVYNIMTNAIITKSELQRNKIICEGKIEAYILYLTESLENPIYSLKKEIPFSYMIDCNSNSENIECEIKSTIKHANYNLNSGGGIEIRCLLAIECVLSKDIVINNITDVKTETNERRQGIVIYFASEGEGVWDIAKHYGVPCESLARYNDIDGERVETRSKIFIPMR